MCASSASATSTDDKIVISTTSLNPGGETATVTVGIEGNTLYSAYEMDLLLPAGVSIVYNANGNPDVTMVKGASSIYPSTVDVDGEKTYSHLFGCSYNAVGANVLRVSCLSTASENFTATSGALFRFTVKAGSYTKPSDLNITVSNYHLITRTAEQNEPKEAPVGCVTVTDKCSVPVAISSVNKYGTAVFPFSVASVPEGLAVYSISEAEGDNLMLQREESIDAFTPYMLYAENGFTGTFTGKVDVSRWVSTSQSGYLIGLLESKSVSEGFILQNKGDGAQFYMVAPYTYALSAGKCYLKLDSNVTYSRLRFVHSDDVNGIEVTPAISTNGRIYSIEGIEVSRPQSGHVYIQGGKKIIY
ncbi:MAG: hypothetical protein J5663_06045 [Bacteroidaceae bacterium]|nr:hypothetical protein [Bacteroidaceae bacterium]